MAEIKITELTDAYEAEIGHLRGQIIRSNVGHEAELREVQARLSGVLDAMEAIRSKLGSKANSDDYKEIFAAAEAAANGVPVSAPKS